MYGLNYYKTKVYVYLNLDKTNTNYLASKVCLEFLKYWYFTYSLTRHVLTTSLELLQVYIYSNLDKTSTNYLASNVCLELLQDTSLCLFKFGQDRY